MVSVKPSSVLSFRLSVMTLFSSPSYTTMPRNRACSFATNTRLTGRTVRMPALFRLILLDKFIYSNLTLIVLFFSGHSISYDHLIDVNSSNGKL